MVTLIDEADLRDPVPRSRQLGEPLRDKDDKPEPEPKPKRSHKAGASAAPSRSPSRYRSLKAPLQGMLELIARVWATRDAQCAQALLDAAPDIAEQTDLAAKNDPKFYRFLEKSMQGSGYTGILIAVYPVIASIREHHVTPAIERIQERRQAAFLEDEGFPPPPTASPRAPERPTEVPVPEGSIVGA